jgi:hypothetical protein
MDLKLRQAFSWGDEGKHFSTNVRCNGIFHWKWWSHLFFWSLTCVAPGHPGHEIPRTENRTENTENRTENTETEFFGTLFGSWFSGTEFTEVNSVLYLGEPNLPNLPKCDEFECSYIINSVILVYYILYIWYSTHIILWTCIFMYLTLLFSMKSFSNYVKISFWSCYYMSMGSVRYFSVNTETEPKIPKPNFLGTDFWKEPIGTYFVGNRIFIRTEVPNRTESKYRMPRVSPWNNIFSR